jgi:hypothetical protein
MVFQIPVAETTEIILEEGREALYFIAGPACPRMRAKPTGPSLCQNQFGRRYNESENR